MIRDRELILRPAECRPEHTELLLKLRNDLELVPLILNRPSGLRSKEIEEWIERRTAQKGTFLFVAHSKDVAVGYLLITEVDPVSRISEIGLCFLPDFHGQGLGRRALTVVEEFLWRVWGTRKLVARIRSDNVRSIQLFQARSFTRVGTHRAHFYYDGRYFDVELFEKILGPDSGKTG
jgi:diamine N-acetyltransferase